MKADYTWLDNPEVFRVGALDPHSDHKWFCDETSCDKEEETLKLSLNGEWDFIFSKNPMEKPENFFQEGFEGNFSKIQVPCHIEMAGFDQIQYTNVSYPWDGKIYRRPAYTLSEDFDSAGSFSKGEDNSVGSYRKIFDLPEHFLGKRIILRFEGAEQAVYAWINGHFLGYAEDCFTITEFDLTPYIKEKKNTLAIQVFKHCTASYIEDQDFFRFFGLFRSVSVLAKPDIHVEDIWIRAVLDTNLKSGLLSYDVKIDEKESFSFGKIEGCLYDQDGKEVAHLQGLSVQNYKMDEVLPWNNKNPYLYKLVIKIFDKEGNLMEVVPQKIGFRRIEILDKVIYFNGRRLIINGVNRHEWSCYSGRVISKQEMEADIECFKRNHINAVRTCHYPDQVLWYDLCDQNGIMMMSETNLESHGSWANRADEEICWNVPGSFPKWKACILDRARNHFEQLKNHTAILFWSLGNESYAGDNIVAEHDYFKKKDSTRLTHYEGVSVYPSLKNVVSDVESRMYAKPWEIREYLEKEGDKPFLLCEYMHDMGNSIGGMGSYMKLLEEYPSYQGGFIWDFIDQSIMVEDEITGRKVLRYGGDFDDRPSDYEFSGNGIVFGDRTEKPAMQEVRYYYGLYE